MGMSTNLFISPYISSTNPIAILFQIIGIELFIHIINGCLIFVFAIWILILIHRLQRKLITNLAILALISTATAIFGGLIFFFFGQNDTYSMMMAMSFISIFTIYFVDIILIEILKKTAN